MCIRDRWYVDLWAYAFNTGDTEDLMKVCQVEGYCDAFAHDLERMHTDSYLVKPLTNQYLQTNKIYECSLQKAGTEGICVEFTFLQTPAVFRYLTEEKASEEYDTISTVSYTHLTPAPTVSSEAAMSGGYQVGPDGVLVRPTQYAADTYTKPELPEEAKENTERGAELAAEYVVETLTYAWNTGDTQPFADITEAGESFRETYIGNIHNLYAHGWMYDNSSTITAVSYTHLDVYKRQSYTWPVMLSMSVAGAFSKNFTIGAGGPRIPSTRPAGCYTPDPACSPHANNTGSSTCSPAIATSHSKSPGASTRTSLMPTAIPTKSAARP